MPQGLFFHLTMEHREPPRQGRGAALCQPSLNLFTVVALIQRRLTGVQELVPDLRL